jgi:transposase
MIDLVAERVWLAAGVTDMRKSIDGLAAIVKYEMGIDPTEPAIFVFCGRRRDRIKLLYWDVNGFWLLYKRLEGGRFRWPAPGTQAMLLSRRQLAWLLDGLQVEQRQAHKPVRATFAV